MRRFPFILLGLLGMSLPLAAMEKIPVKVVVVTMFEVGGDSGDNPGEFQFWVERLKLEQKIPAPLLGRDLRSNGRGVLALVTGMGTAKAAASIMALGTDPRFDFSKTYWLVAGIAGIDPADGSIGSAVWADYVVDGDLGHEIDGREIPSTWPTGYVPLFQSSPYAEPKQEDRGEVYRLNPSLAEWAYQLTRDTPLLESEVMQKNRRRYLGYPKAQAAPRVLKGATISSGTFWHGKKLDQWANDWTKYWTGGKGNYVTTAMEDTGTLQALTLLAKAGRIDLNRVLVLRTASNFDMPPEGMTAAESLAEENKGSYSAYLPSLEAAYRVGSRVVLEISEHWEKYETKIP